MENFPSANDWFCLVCMLDSWWLKSKMTPKSCQAFVFKLLWFKLAFNGVESYREQFAQRLCPARIVCRMHSASENGAFIPRVAYTWEATSFDSDKNPPTASHWKVRVAHRVISVVQSSEEPPRNSTRAVEVHPIDQDGETPVFFIRILQGLWRTRSANVQWRGDWKSTASLQLVR